MNIRKTCKLGNDLDAYTHVEEEGQNCRARTT